LEDPGVDGRRILKCLFKTWDGGKVWIHQAQDRDSWQTFVNAIINIQVSYNARNFLSS
jgi:hypothetical protein